MTKLLILTDDAYETLSAVLDYEIGEQRSDDPECVGAAEQFGVTRDWREDHHNFWLPLPSIEQMRADVAEAQDNDQSETPEWMIHVLWCDLFEVPEDHPDYDWAATVTA